ncbi:hypothetical protein [Ideonella sp.]|jgi:hypothetical protein|uniref:hypothetical protein n=1 Tax=Ideonella sp. TaxID=1929293 RepID=UPI0037C0B99B
MPTFTRNAQQRFLYSEVAILAWGASVQRANLYNSAIPAKDRASDSFRASVLSFIETQLLSSYKTGCSEAAHIANIERLVEFATAEGGKLLGPDGYKFGVAQKLLNLLLKYLWCLGHVAEPPHCPVDRLILAKTSHRNKLNWTEITAASEYKDAINAIRIVAKAADLSLPQWELQFYSRR